MSGHVLSSVRAVPLLPRWQTATAADAKRNCVIVQVLPERLEDVRRTFKTTNPDDVRVELGTPVIPA